MDNTKYYLDGFKKFIALRSSSPNTVKNYLSDLRLFFNFTSDKLTLPVSPETLPVLLSESTLVKYDEFLSSTNPPATAKRRISSLKKFIEFCATQNIISTAPPAIPTPPSTPSPAPSVWPQIPTPPGPSAFSAYPPTAVASPLIATPAPSQPGILHTAESIINTAPNVAATPPSWTPPSPSQIDPAPPPPSDHSQTSSSPSLVNFLPDLTEPEIRPTHGAAPKNNTVSLYLVLSLSLIAFLAFFSLTYFITTTLLSK